ncbi:hypothetical protein HNR74_000818 [Flammeovirga kamogawensis]|nr:hypothetical protein [Flammeovirga kamogawensis]
MVAVRNKYDQTNTENLFTEYPPLQLFFGVKIGI